MDCSPFSHEEASRNLRMRILEVLPAATYQMDRFFQFTDIVLSDQTETACVEVGAQPRLHLNADFVARYCKRDEHLLMLVLHELYHVILGHTRLFPRLSENHNIAFDAVINALLCHQFKEPIYIGFFQRINSGKEFPGRLLRPPIGWPGALHFPSETPESEQNIIARLYGDRPTTVTYVEILELLQQNCPAPPQKGGFVLLGDHSGANRIGSSDQTAVGDTTVREILRRMTENWPEESRLEKDKGLGNGWGKYLMPPPKKPRTQFLIALKKLLTKAGVLLPYSSSPYAWKVVSYDIETTTVLPNFRDRKSHAQEVLTGFTPIFFQSESIVHRAKWRPENTVHVYIDVSGSMNNEIPWLIGALAPLHRKGLCRLYAFSTVVDEVRRGSLSKGKIKNTFGTNISCVYNHLLALSPRQTPRRFVVLTDGYTGRPKPEEVSELKNRGVKMFVGLVGFAREAELKPYATSLERLPSLT